MGEPILQPEGPRSKGGLTPFAPPERSRSIALPWLPSSELADVIWEYSDQGRAAWDLGTDNGLIDAYAGPLVVPRVPEFPRGGHATAHAVWSVPHAGDVLRPRVALAVESQDPLAWQAMDERDHAELLKLRAAAARDIAGLNGEQLAAALTYTDESTVRTKVRGGRRLLRALGAWPWCAFRQGARITPPSWWSTGDPCAHALLGWWVAPDLLGWAGVALADLT